MENSFSFSFNGSVELLKYVYFYAQKSIIKAGNNKFQDLINAPRTLKREKKAKHKTVLDIFCIVDFLIEAYQFVVFTGIYMTTKIKSEET